MQFSLLFSKSLVFSHAKCIQTMRMMMTNDYILFQSVNDKQQTGIKNIALSQIYTKLW